MPAKRERRPSFTAANPRYRVPHGSGPRGISSTHFSEKNRLTPSRSWLLKAAKIDSSVATEGPSGFIPDLSLQYVHQAGARALESQRSDMMPQSVEKQLDRRRDRPAFQRDDDHWKAGIRQFDRQLPQAATLGIE